MGTVVTSSCWGCESEHIQGEGTERERLGHSWTSVSLRDCPNHTPVPGVVLVLCMACLKAVLTRGILQHTDAALAVPLPRQAVPDLGRPQQAHRGNDKACGFTAMVGTLDLLVFFISVVLG